MSAGHTRTDVEQRTTRNVTEFTAGAGFLDVKGTVKQVGSLIDGNFTLNSNGYEHEDLKDIDKSRTVGINVTRVCPKSWTNNLKTSFLFVKI